MIARNKKPIIMQMLMLVSILLTLSIVLDSFGISWVGAWVCIGASALNWYRRWNTPALTANEHGITDATGAVPGGLVYWNEIAAIDTVKSPSETLLLLHLRDPDAYLARLPEPTRRLLAGSVSIYGTPCVVAQNDIGVPVAQALQTLTEARVQFAGLRVPLAAAVGSATVEAATPTVSNTASPAHWWTAVPPEERAAKATQAVGRHGDQ